MCWLDRKKEVGSGFGNIWTDNRNGEFVAVRTYKEPTNENPNRGL
jgi:hypothetical protein